MENLASTLIADYILQNAYVFQIIPCLVGIIFMKSIKPFYVYLAGIFLLAFVGDNVQYYFFQINYNTLWVSNLMILMQIPIYYKLFTSLDISNVRLLRSIQYLFFVVLLFGIYRTFMHGNILEYKNLVYALACILYILCGLIYLFDFALYSDINKLKVPLEIFFITSMILYYTITVGIYFIARPGALNDQLVWIIRNITLILYSFICGFIIYKSTIEENG